MIWSFNSIKYKNYFTPQLNANIESIVPFDMSLLTIVKTDRARRHLSYSIEERRDDSIDVTC